MVLLRSLSDRGIRQLGRIILREFGEEWRGRGIGNGVFREKCTNLVTTNSKIFERGRRKRICVYVEQDVGLFTWSGLDLPSRET